MEYKITKLDRRHNGYSFYKYYVTPTAIYTDQAVPAFVKLRNWCWETYGSSAELGWTYRGDLWAWETEYKRKRIYLKSDAELMLFKLKFS